MHKLFSTSPGSKMTNDSYAIIFLLLAFSFYKTNAAGSYVVDDTSGIERKFDGIGGLSGGGATSKLLVNYPETQRNQILDYLFKPNFGASLQILKVEIGGDAQTTDGTESSHMHESWDENYQRGYEWWLMIEAKKRNPNIKLYGLPWAYPGWVGRGTGNPYSYPKDTAMYVVKWILAAKKYYNLTIDYIGIWNERDYDITYILTLKSTLLANGLGNVRIVASDNGWDISGDILKNTSLASAVDVIGCHYPGTKASGDALNTMKPLWASEDYSTFNDNVGAGCWARILNQNYVNGFMTSTISWNLIAAYYESLPYGRDGLMTAEEPWSGHYVVESPIWMTAHTTQFTNIGWSYLKHGAGVQKLDFGGSMVTLISPDKNDFTIIIETMSHDHSYCIRPGLPPYTVTAQQLEFALGGSLLNVRELHVWKSSLGFGGQMSSLFHQLPTIKPYIGQFTMTMQPDEIYTLTTLTVGQKGNFPLDPPVSKPFPLPYFDNYDNYAEYTEPYNFAPQSGVFEVRKSLDPQHKMIARQVIITRPIVWCPTDAATISIGGSSEWTDLFFRSDVYIPLLNGTNGVFIAARVDRGGCDAKIANGIFYSIFPVNNSYLATTDIRRSKVVASGTFKRQLKLDTWYNMGLIVRGTKAWGFLDADFIFQASLPTNITKGFAGYGTTNYGIADFDNLVAQSSTFKHAMPDSSNQDGHHFLRL